MKKSVASAYRKLYSGLKPEGKTLVHACALMGMPIRPASLFRWLAESGLRMDHGAPFSPMATKSLLTALLKSKLLVEGEDGVEVAEAFAEEAGVAALKDKALTPAVFALADYIPDAIFVIDPDAPHHRVEKHLRRLRWLLRVAVQSESASLFELCGNELIHLRQERGTPLSPDPVKEAIEVSKYDTRKKKDPAFLSMVTSYMTAICLTDLSPLPGGRVAIDEMDSFCLERLAVLFLYQGNAAARDELLPLLPEETRICHRAIDALFDGQYAAAVKDFEKALSLVRKMGGDRTALLDSPFDLFMMLAHFADRTPKGRKSFDRMVKLMEQSVVVPGCREQALYLMQSLWDGRADSLPFEFDREFERVSLGQQWILLLLLWVADNEAFLSVLPACLEVIGKAEAGGYGRVAVELLQACALEGARGCEDAPQRTEALLKQLGLASALSGRFAPQAPWEHALTALESLGRAANPNEESMGEEFDSRLVWQLTVEEREGAQSYAPTLKLQPVEQKRRKNGGWSKGRKVSLGRLCEDREEMPYVTDQDWEVCAAIKQDHFNREGFRQTEYSFALDEALVSLAGHPNVFWSHAPRVRVEVVTGTVELRIAREEEGYLMQLFPAVHDNEYGVAVLRESPTRVRVIPLDSAYRQLSPILGTGGIVIPKNGEKRLKSVMSMVAGVVPIHSDLAGAVVEGAVITVEPEIRPVLHLMPHGEGLRADLLVRPLGDEGPCAVPGSGAETLIADIRGERKQTRRNLLAERSDAKAIIEACPLLASEPSSGMNWIFEHPEDCLELLASLQTLSGKLTVEWPRGGEFKVSTPLDWSGTTISIKKKRDWFAVDGKVEVAEGQVMELRSLLDLLAEAKGRFIPLGQGQFLTLTEEFKRRLETIESLGTSEEDGFLVNPLAAPGLDEVLAEVEALEADAEWQAFRERLRSASEIAPVVPSTLQAELRDYQVEGFHWLCRLSHWGAGACLADDMGLGKTMQALALLLERATAGPALVVAPTSVCFNWVEEAERFAPTLNVIPFGPGDRKATVTGLGPRDVLVASYSLLQQEEGLVTGPAWATVVLDEAQAIKNADTKRSKAAMKLSAGFRLITTGTPLENHLGELWNLFQFINPGLLGPAKRFNEEFALPIERTSD
ncbi:MAG: DEAD/DEAH box helicase, partial [Planctomycetota bacterium]